MPTAEAAKEIKTLITTSGDQVRSGVGLVEQTGAALEEIVAQVREIDHYVSAIVTSAREQATGIGEINTAVTTIDQGTQQNAAMVEQSTAASHGLAREAGALIRLIGQLNLGGQEAASAKAAPAAASPARRIGGKVIRAFGGSSAAVETKERDDWEEF